MDINSKNGGDLALQSQPQATVKQEKLEPVESTNENSDLIPDSQSYILQQQQLQYETDFQYKELKESNADSMANVSENSDEPIAKRPRRRRQATKPVPPESLDSSDNDNDAGDSMLEMTVTKTEEESESDGDENVDDPEPAKYGSAGDDTEQPGPSGLGKGGTDAPLFQIPKRWLCEICSEEFPTRKNMVEHRRSLHAFILEPLVYKYVYNSVDDSYTCKTCDTEMKTKDEIEKHMLEHEDKFVCDHCQQVFYSAYKFSIHVRKHTNEKIFKCPLCEYSTVRRTSISVHINRIHLKKFLYHCQFCGKGFHDPVTFKEHENIHMGADPLACVVCEKVFNFSKNLTMHQLRSHTVRILGVPIITNLKQCKFCKKSYSKMATLERHMKTHDKTIPKEKTHLCDTCGKGFPRKDKLMLHYRIHTGYKPYKCSYCEKTFSRKPYLILHERTHSGEKPYCCDHCGKRFNQRSSLGVHIRSHTGERPYSCLVCNQGFMSKSTLKHHVITCSG